MNLHRPSGFTLAELMVVIAIAGVLTAAGAPAFSEFIKNNRLRSETLDLFNHINFARSEALKRKSAVAICRSADPLADDPVCGGTDRTWTSGWLVFQDQSNPLNGTFEDGTDILLKIGPPSGLDIDVTSNGTSNRNLAYNLDGTTREGGGTASFAVCDSRGDVRGRLILVPPHGRPRLVIGTEGEPIDCTPL